MTSAWCFWGSQELRKPRGRLAVSPRRRAPTVSSVAAGAATGAAAAEDAGATHALPTNSGDARGARAGAAATAAASLFLSLPPRTLRVLQPAVAEVLSVSPPLVPPPIE